MYCINLYCIHLYISLKLLFGNVSLCVLETSNNIFKGQIAIHFSCTCRLKNSTSFYNYFELNVCTCFGFNLFSGFVLVKRCPHAFERLALQRFFV